MAANRLHTRFLRSIKVGRSRRDCGEQDVTGRSIDWLRLKIGESGRINTVGPGHRAGRSERESGGKKEKSSVTSPSFYTVSFLSALTKF